MTDLMTILVRDWNKMQVIARPCGSHGMIKADADGIKYEWMQGGKRIKARRVL